LAEFHDRRKKLKKNNDEFSAKHCSVVFDEGEETLARRKGEFPIVKMSKKASARSIRPNPTAERFLKYRSKKSRKIDDTTKAPPPTSKRHS